MWPQLLDKKQNMWSLTTWVDTIVCTSVDTFAGHFVGPLVGSFEVLKPWESERLRARSWLLLWAHLREGKPRGFQTGAFPLFSGKVQIVLRMLLGLFLVDAVNRPRKRKRTNWKILGLSPGKSGKSQKKRESAKRTKKEGQVQIGKPPRFHETRPAGAWHFRGDTSVSAPVRFCGVTFLVSRALCLSDLHSTCLPINAPQHRKCSARCASSSIQTSPDKSWSSRQPPVTRDLPNSDNAWKDGKDKDAACLLTVGGFLLTELFYLQLCLGGLSLQLKLFYLQL